MLAELLEHVIEERHTRRRRSRAPSRRASSSTRMSVSFVVRFTVAVRRHAASTSSIASGTGRSRARCPAVTRSAFGTTAVRSRTSTPRSSRPCHTATASPGGTNRTKFASLGYDGHAGHRAERARTIRSRCTRIAASRPRAPRRGAASATMPAAWVSAERWYGRRTRCRSADDGRVGEHVAEPRARHRERLREGPDDRDVRVRSATSGSAVLAAELDVRLVDDHQRAAARASASARDRRDRLRVAGRVVRGAHEDDVGVRRPPRLRPASSVEHEVLGQPQRRGARCA